MQEHTPYSMPCNYPPRQFVLCYPLQAAALYPSHHLLQAALECDACEHREHLWSREGLQHLHEWSSQPLMAVLVHCNGMDSGLSGCVAGRSCGSCGYVQCRELDSGSSTPSSMAPSVGASPRRWSSFGQKAARITEEGGALLRRASEAAGFAEAGARPHSSAHVSGSSSPEPGEQCCSSSSSNQTTTVQ